MTAKPWTLPKVGLSIPPIQFVSYILKSSEWYFMGSGAWSTHQKSALRFDSREAALEEAKTLECKTRVVKLVRGWKL